MALRSRSHQGDRRAPLKGPEIPAEVLHDGVSLHEQEQHQGEQPATSAVHGPVDHRQEHHVCGGATQRGHGQHNAVKRGMVKCLNP